MKVIVLDRDGVINHDSVHYIKSIEEWVAIPGSLEAIARLHHGGWQVLVASNQSGLARGLFTIDDLNAMHRKMHQELARFGARIEAVFFCPHGPDDDCSCRKPRPGLLEDIGRRLSVDLVGVPVVGDALRDIEAAQAVRAQPILVRTGKGKPALQAGAERLLGVPVYDDLSAVADALLQGQ